MFTTLLGIPIDCSGRAIGVERMPQALRQAGLLEAVALPDGGDLPVTLADPLRDPVTGIIGFSSVCQVSQQIQAALIPLFESGQKPLILGGCCTLLMGLFAALKHRNEPVGLAFVDGHLDFYDGVSSPTGEAADMDLAILTGFGPPELVNLAPPSPLVSPHHVAVLGFRDEILAQADGAPNPRLLAPDMAFYDVPTLRRHDLAHLGHTLTHQFTQTPGRFWLHLDLDVLDEHALPAVDYRMPGGLNWGEVAQLVKPLAASPACLGLDVTIYNPTLDPDGRWARRIVGLLSEIV